MGCRSQEVLFPPGLLFGTSRIRLVPNKWIVGKLRLVCETGLGHSVPPHIPFSSLSAVISPPSAALLLVFRIVAAPLSSHTSMLSHMLYNPIQSDVRAVD